MLTGQTIAITGANTGVGRATAIALARLGARVLLMCRSREAGRRVAGEIGHLAELVEMDLADLASVRRAADEVAARAPHLDVLMNNAGVGGARGLTKDGFELAFGVNYLGHYALTRHLLIRARQVRRVVHLTSGSHAKAESLDFESFRRPTRSVTGVAEYAASKLCVMLFHHELTRRHPEVVSLAADPGDVASDAWRHVPWFVRPFLSCGMKSPDEGALTSVFCATDPALSSASGQSFVDARRFTPSRLSLDAGLARHLWERSAHDVGIAGRDRCALGS